VVLINMDEVDAHELGEQLIKLVLAATPASAN